MGAFSWLRAERTTQRKNIAVGDIYKILIPQEFGGGFIRDEYCGSGIVFGDDWDHMADLYGILAYCLNYKFSATIQVTQNFQQKRTII